MSGLIKSKKILAGLIAGVIATGGVATAVNAGSLFNFFKKEEAPEEPEIVIQEVETRDIENTVNLTGALASASEVTSSINAKASELAVKEVKVKVGDQVKAGDVLFTLDTSDLERTIRETEKKLAILERKNTINANQEQREKDKLEKDNAIDSAQELRDIRNTEDHLDDNYFDQGLALDELYGKYGIEDQTYYDAVNAELAVFDAEDELNAAYECPDISVDELNELIGIYNSAVETFNEAVGYYESAIKDSIASETTVRTNDRTIRDAEKGLIDKQENFDKSERERAEAEKKAADSREINSMDRSVSDQEDLKALEKARETMAVSTVTATITGVVTAVNVKEGSVPTTDPVVITDLGNFNVACDVDEQYIADIVVGQNVRFTTNATGDEPLKGKVVFTAATPTKQQTSNNNSGSGDGTAATSTSGQTDKSRGTYRVLIKAEDTNDRLRPGMSAKITIVTSEAKGVLSVPNECISFNNDGQAVLNVTTDAGATTSEVPIEIGLTDGTYTEVRGEGISAGTQVVVPVAEDFTLDLFG